MATETTTKLIPFIPTSSSYKFCRYFRGQGIFTTEIVILALVNMVG
jgi:hypothetical protein